MPTCMVCDPEYLDRWWRFSVYSDVQQKTAMVKSQGSLHGSEACVVVQDPMLRKFSHLVQCSPVTILKFLIIFEQDASCFYFILGSASDVACPVAKGLMEQAASLWIIRISSASSSNLDCATSHHSEFPESSSFPCFFTSRNLFHYLKADSEPRPGHPRKARADSAWQPDAKRRAWEAWAAPGSASLQEESTANFRQGPQHVSLPPTSDSRLTTPATVGWLLRTCWLAGRWCSHDHPWSKVLVIVRGAVILCPSEK